MIIQTVTIGDYKANLYLYKLGYQYKIFTKIKGKTTCVARSYAYIFDKQECYNEMMEDLKVTMGMVKLLFD
jgi:hypothetical protein